MNRKGFGLIEILIAAAAVAIVAGGGYYFSQLKNKQAIVQTEQNILNPGKTIATCVATSSQFSGWRVYQNDQYGFTFCTSPDWNIVQTSSSGSLTLSVQLPDDTKIGRIFIFTPQQWAAIEQADEAPVLLLKTTNWIYGYEQSQALSPSQADIATEFSSALTTFKVIPSARTAVASGAYFDTSTWPTYVNEAYNFSFKYPPLGEKQQVLDVMAEGDRPEAINVSYWSKESNNFLETFSFSVATSSGISLHDWFENNIDDASGTLLHYNNFTLRSIPGGGQAYVLTNVPIPSSYLDGEGGPVSDAYIMDPQRQHVFTLNVSQASELGLYYNDGPNMIPFTLLSTFQFISPSWRTYTDSQHGFSFQYPSFLYLVATHALPSCDYAIVCLQNTPKDLEIGGAIPDNVSPSAYATSGYAFDFDIESSSQPFDIQQYLASRYQYSEIDTLTPLLIDGVTAYRFTFTGEIDGNFPRIVIPHGSVIYDLFYAGRIYNNKTMSSSIDLFDQVASTFKFISPSWRTYKDQQHGFSFQYPGDWVLTDTAINASDTGEPIILNSPQTIAKAGNNQDAIARGLIDLAFFVGENPQNLSMQDYYNGVNDVALFDKGYPPFVATGTVGNVLAYDVSSPMFPADIKIISRKNYFLRLEISSGSPLIKEILSSFIFEK